MQEIIGQLERLRRRSRIALVIQRTAVLAACVIGGLLAIILLDFVLRLPAAFRAVLALAGLGALGYLLWTYIGGAVAFRPSLIQLALRAESVLPSVAGRLASSLEFAASGTDETNELAARSVRDTQTRLRGEPVHRIVRLDRTWRSIAALVVVAGGAAALAVTNPAAARTGLERVLLPFGDARWPARTGVASLMDEVVPETGVHPRGQALALRARVTKGDDEQRVWVRLRMRRDGRMGDWQELVLTHQGGGVHERLVDTDAEEMELYFRTADDRCATERVKLVPSPAVVRATLRIDPPPFASGRIAPVEQEMGPGTDARSVTERPALVGSIVRLDIVLNKPLPLPDAPRDGWLSSMLGWPDRPLPSFTAAGDQPVWTLRWTLAHTRELIISLEDEYGLMNTEPVRYRIEAVEDRPPSVTVLEPQSDEPVLATAVVPLVGEATDDVAIARVALEARVRRAADERDDPAAEPAWIEQLDADAATARVEADLDLSRFELGEGDTVLVQGVASDMFELDGERHDEQRSAVRRLRVISELDFATQLRRQLGAVRQNAIRIEGIQAELQDDLVDNGPQPGLDRAQAQIGERIADQREALDDVARQLDQNRLDDEALRDLLDQASDLLDFAGRAASEAVGAIQQRSASATPGAGRRRPGAPRENAGAESGGEQPSGEQPGGEQPGDEQPGGEQAGGEQAGGEQPGGEQPGGEQPGGEQPGGEQPDDPAADLPIPELREPQEEDRSIFDAQQEVREELEDLIELLDRDEDTWVVTRQLESLLEQQSQLLGETARLNQRTMGRDRTELTEQEESELDRITEQQEDLRDQARQAIESIRDRVPALEEVDPESAEGMRSAADLAEQRELDRDMQSAADRARENQLRNAMSRQQAAAETLQRMLEQIEESKRAQTEQLLRRLASLQESIERLINVQEGEIVALERARAAGEFVGRDRAMIRLNQNTQVVATEARTAGQETRRIARSLDRAADAQGAAVVALRADPVNGEEAARAEERSLELLKEALALTEELEQQTQEEQTRQRREELIQAYRDLAEREVAIREQTLRLADEGELNRRQLVEARRLATEQDEIARGLDDLRATNSELLDASVFSMVHDRMERWAARASNGLRDGDVSVEVSDRQDWIARAVGRLIEALEEAVAPPDEFAGESDSGGNAGSGAPGQDRLIPPVAQLKLLQGIQQEIYDRTRDLDQRGDLEPAARRQRLRDAGQQQRELLELGEELLEQFRNQDGGQAPDGPRPG
ncbi:MAG: coiled-coil domain-containing protein [Planctomycetota bacterium]|jgi:hypothetical protein